MLCPSATNTERGQATTEFLVALMVLAPLFFGVFYFARYADVKHSAIQASRYVAFERTWDPYNRAKTPAQLSEEVRSRFFMAGGRNNGELRFRDSSTGQDATAKANRVPLWSDAAYKPMLARYSDVAVTERDAGALATGPVGKLQETIGAPIFKLPTSGIVKAEVTVSLANVAHFDALRDINIGLPGATAIGAGVWNASGAKEGAQSVCARVSPSVLGTYIKPVADVLGVLMAPTFEKNAPDIGIVLPDYSIPGSVRNKANNNVPYTGQQGNRC